MKVTKPNVSELFLQASALDSEDARARFLDEACAGHPELRAEIESLLGEQNQLGDFLESPAMDAESRSTTLVQPSGESEHIGVYKLLQEVGEGGCGVVYMAEQEKPVRRRVALKVIKLGMDTKSVIARFESERQALAMMDHPNIAKVLDAGTTDRGRPYFVMELVRGIRITDYCDQHKLATEERMKLFIQVSLAIQHAHQKGIIHRDIKPSNILVTLHDGVPVPKIIDFGIAKATEQRLTDKTLFTEFQSFIGTPAYMSPEQAEMSGLDIDTRSDIYALGVLLYELLVGKTPFDAAELRDGGLDACRQTIREVEPARPSQRVSTMIDADQATTASFRHTEPGKLVHKLKGDLDWIVMKCLEKDRQRRYATANALAADVQCALDGDVVLARPPSKVYRLQKLIRRNRVAVMAATAIGVTLVAAVIISTWQALVATQAKREASAAQAEQSTLREVAEKDREQALANASRARANEYVAEMNLAHRALADGNLGRAFQLIDKHKTEDQLGFEWRYLRELCEGDEHLSFPNQGSTVRVIAFSPDGDLLAVGLRDAVHLWDVRTRSRVIQLPVDSRSLAFSPNGRTLYTAGRDGVQAWNATTWILQGSTPDRAEALAISPEGARLLIGTRRHVRLYDTATWETIWELPDASAPIAFSHDGESVITDSREGLQRRRAQDGKILVTMQDSGRLFSSSVRFSGDDRQIIAPRNVTSERGSFVLSVWDAGSGEERRSVSNTVGHTGMIFSLSLSSDGVTLASASLDHSIGLWDLASRRSVAMLRGHRHEVWSLAFAPDNQSLVTGGKDGSLLLWPNQAPSRSDVITGMGESLGFTPEGTQLACLNDEKRLLHILDLRTRTTVRSLPLTKPNSKDRPVAAMNRDCTTMVQMIDDGVFQIQDVASGATHVSSLGDTQADSLKLSPNGDHLITRSYRGAASWWRLGETPILIKKFEAAQSMLFSDDGRVLIAVSREGAVQVWDVKTASELRSFEAKAGGRGVAISSDGAVLATTGHPFGSVNSIWLWSTKSGDALAELEGHKQSVVSLAFTPDGLSLASSSDDSTLKFWHLATNQELLSIRNVGTTLNHLRFSADGQWLVGDVGGFSRVNEMHLFHAPSRDL
ncbi:MAG: serine/threonine protein kinase/WD40 repeat protein [Verrucomicrobiales bacterium]|jgi:serine/threonine protein kinase/WD40 repeat protein